MGEAKFQTWRVNLPLIVGWWVPRIRWLMCFQNSDFLPFNAMAPSQLVKCLVWIDIKPLTIVAWFPLSMLRPTSTQQNTHWHEYEHTCVYLQVYGIPTYIYTKQYTQKMQDVDREQMGNRMMHDILRIVPWQRFFLCCHRWLSLRYHKTYLTSLRSCRWTHHVGIVVNRIPFVSLVGGFNHLEKYEFVSWDEWWHSQ